MGGGGVQIGLYSVKTHIASSCGSIYKLENSYLPQELVESIDFIKRNGHSQNDVICWLVDYHFEAILFVQ